RTLAASVPRPPLRVATTTIAPMPLCGAALSTAVGAEPSRVGSETDACGSVHVAPAAQRTTRRVTTAPLPLRRSVQPAPVPRASTTVTGTSSVEPSAAAGAL